MAKANLKPRKGVTFEGLTRGIANVSSGGNSSDGGIESRIGSQVLHGFLSQFENGVPFMGSNTGGGASNFREVVSAVKDLQGVGFEAEDRHMKRAREEAERADRLEKELMELRRNEGNSQIQMMQLMMTMLMKMQDSSTNAMAEVLKEIKNSTDKQFEALKQAIEKTNNAGRSSGGGGDDILKTLGQQFLQQAINQDPKEKFLQELGFYKQLIGGGDSRPDPELLRIEKEMELERLRLEKDYELKEQGQKRSQALAEILNQFVGFSQQQAAQSRGMNQQPAASAGSYPAAPISGTEVQQAPPMPLYRYECGSCQHEFTLGADVTRTACPKCNEMIYLEDEEPEEIEVNKPEDTDELDGELHAAAKKETDES